MIEIKKWVKPDIIKILHKTNNYSSEKFTQYSILIEQSIMVTHDCHEDGEIESYKRDGKYFGLRVNKDIIEVCIPKYGWIPVYEEIQEIYNNEIAEKAIFGE